MSSRFLLNNNIQNHSENGEESEAVLANCELLEEAVALPYEVHLVQLISTYLVHHVLVAHTLVNNYLCLVVLALSDFHELIKLLLNLVGLPDRLELLSDLPIRDSLYLEILKSTLGQTNNMLTLIKPCFQQHLIIL